MNNIIASKNRTSKADNRNISDTLASAKQQYFVTGIGTEVGKTIVSAILVQALQADYWKPVQAGDLEQSDTIKVKSWVNNTNSKFHPEQYRLNTPMSPHAAAAIDGVNIQLSNFVLPKTENHLIVEGAGGLLVPLNEQETILDLMAQLQLPVILVARHYLGSINHTLLSISALKQRNIPIKGLIFNGNEHPTTEAIIKKMGDVPILGRIEELTKITSESIQKTAATWTSILSK